MREGPLSLTVKLLRLLLAAGHTLHHPRHPQDRAGPAPAGQVGGEDRRGAEPQDGCVVGAALLLPQCAGMGGG